MVSADLNAVPEAGGLGDFDDQRANLLRLPLAASVTAVGLVARRGIRFIRSFVTPGRMSARNHTPGNEGPRVCFVLRSRCAMMSKHSTLQFP